MRSSQSTPSAGWRTRSVAAEAVATEWLHGTPSNRNVVPGVYLGAVVGSSCLGAAVLAVRDHPGARVAALGASGVLVTWIGAEMALIGYRSPLQPVMLAAGVAIAWTAARP